MKKKNERKVYYTVIIEPDGCTDFEDYTDKEQAYTRARELRERGIDAAVGITEI